MVQRNTRFFRKNAKAESEDEVPENKRQLRSTNEQVGTWAPQPVVCCCVVVVLLLCCCRVLLLLLLLLYFSQRIIVVRWADLIDFFRSFSSVQCVFLFHVQ